jgi:phosphonate transport system substrate-binding protein
MIKNTIKIISIFLFVLAIPVKAENLKKPLILGIHPYLDEAELIKRFTPLTQYLSKALKQPVKIKVASHYQQHIDYIGKNQVDIAFMRPAPYVKMVKLHGLKPILARLEINGNPTFHGKIIVRKDSAISSLHDLIGKDMAFGDPKSTMSFVVPRWTMKKFGINISLLKSYRHLSNHMNVAYSVLMGDFDAGAVKEEVFYSLKDRGLKAIATTPAISEHLFVANNYLPVATLNTLRSSLYQLKKHKNGKNILQSIKPAITAMVPAKDSDYKILKKIMFLENANRRLND